MATAAVALNLPVPALDDETSCLADAAAAAAGFKFESIDDYEMIEEIGEGTFGIVAKARDRRTGETVAVKWIRSSGEGQTPRLPPRCPPRGELPRRVPRPPQHRGPPWPRRRRRDG